jgi:hypothetical protein
VCVCVCVCVCVYTHVCVCKEVKVCFFMTHNTTYNTTRRLSTLMTVPEDMRDAVGAPTVTAGTVYGAIKHICNEMDFKFPMTFWPMVGVGFVTSNAALREIEGSRV